MAHDDAVQELLARVRQGEQDAAAEVFRLYQRRLIALARVHLDARIRRKVDPADVVQSVFRSYFRREREGEFAVRDWDHLWSLLALMTARKCTNARVYFTRRKRSAHLEISAEGDSDAALASWHALAREPTPAQAAVLADLIEQFFGTLNDRDRRIVLLSLEGHDAAAIGAMIGRAERTVRRTLEHFRRQLQEAVLTPSSVFADEKR